MLSESIREFYLISEALISFIEEVGNENMDFFCIEILYPLLEQAHDISFIGMLQMRKLYD